jgi:hypothetical protein
LVAIVKLSKAGEKKKKRSYLQWRDPLPIYDFRQVGDLGGALLMLCSRFAGLFLQIEAIHKIDE